MKSSGSKEQLETQWKYAFLSDPETTGERTEKSTGILQNPQFAHLRQDQYAKQAEKLVNPAATSNIKNFESFLVNQPVKPHPFTFITAVKRKLAVAAYNETSKKLYYSGSAKTAESLDIQMNKIDASSGESLYEKVQKMEFVKPLKVPDVKISPKTLDYPPKDTSNIRDLTSLKFSLASQKSEKASKSMERAHRKLDFSLSEGHSLISSDDIEPLKAPEFSISPSLSKKKDHMRENSREKENRSKRIKKDESSISKNDDSSQDSKRTKNPKHVSRKDVIEPKRTKNERISSHLSKESEFTSKKPKNKNLSTSTVKKDDDKRLRSSSIHSTKSCRDRSLESRGRTFSSESLSERNFKAHEKITRESSRGTDSDASALKYNDDYQILNALRQLEEQKLKVIENKPPKILPRSSQQKPLEITAKEQHKRISDRTKASTSKNQIRSGSTTSEILEEIETASDSNSNKNRSIYTEISQQSKAKIASNSQANSTIDTQNVTQSSYDDINLDPNKISFRDDSYSQQEEFCDLVTPDINLTLRSKRRKPIPPSENDSEPELKTPKHKPTRSESPQNSGMPLVHPTALHMQFQAELHLFDSYNESLRQVMDVENCLYSVNQEKGKELLQKQRLANEEIRKQLTAMQAERDSREAASVKSSFSDGSPEAKAREDENCEKNAFLNYPAKSDLHEPEEETRSLCLRNKENKADVKVAEVQTQTANDIATQTDIRLARHTVAERLKQYPGITYDRGSLTNCEIPELSLGSLEQFEDLDHIEDISLPSKMRTMSEISLHETTSSIKTETGTEISISTRDVTCSFNKYLDLEMAQLIKDEKLMYDKIEMLFKSREKTLNDRTRKLVKLEEQKRALRDTGQDSRISSVKKKQRALLLKLQQEKDEMNRLKELHKMASQERKLMLQKQRNMFNPQLSTKNILTKLKRSADCQSPRRLSGPMKGYDIRSNSSMSSLVDSDKSQLDRSQIDLKLQLSDSSHRLEGKSLKSDLETSAAEKIDVSNNRKYMSVLEESANSLSHLDQLNDFISSFETPQKLESKARKFEEKMPNLKSNYFGRTKQTSPLNHGQIVEMSEGSKIILQNVENTENLKSESDTLVEELSKKSKPQTIDHQASMRDKESVNLETIHGESDSINSRKSKASQVTEESLLTNYKGVKKSEKNSAADREANKKSQHIIHESKSMNKRKGSKNLKAKSTSNILTENILRSKGNTHISDDIVKPKRTKADKEAIQSEDHYQNSILEELDLNESQNSLQALVKHSRAVKDKNYRLLRDIAREHETKENISTRNVMERSADNQENNSRRDDSDIHNLGNISTRSQVSTFTISRHSSGDSEKSFSRSVVIRAQDHRFKTSKKLEQVLNAREAALTTRRNCVEDWIAWHTKLKAEESRVARMEQAAFKLVSTTANALPYHDTTMSSDTSDVEGRVELLAEKLAERRAEMAKLKREARRQAKQRLKALEANLLSQIKKYDTTIHEMRKKLETQKTTIKDSDKLAIESRSVADFKVPEIPIKRIQEIYKSSDLLRSRSESDLIFSKTLHEDSSRNSYDTDKQEKNSVYKSSSSLDNKISRVSRTSASREGKTNQSAESVLEEAKNFAYNNSEKHSEVSSRESQKISETRCEDNAIPEDFSSSRNSSENHSDQTKNRKSQSSEIPEVSETIKTEENSKIFSRKLETLQLTNKNLNDDISTLENDLKALSEMMSHFSKKSDDKQKLGATESENIATIAESIATSTSKDISEQLSQSLHTELSEEVSKITENLDERISVQTAESIPEKSSVSQEFVKSNISQAFEKSIVTQEFEKSNISQAFEKSSVSREFEKSQSQKSYDEEIQDEVTEVISAILPDGQSSDVKTTEEIDFEARSKEILNVVEKSIISEHVKSPASDLNVSSAALEESMKDMHEENEAMSQDLNSLEGDIKSISKIISEMAESKRNIGLAADLSEAAYNVGESIELQEQTFDMPILQLEDENQISALGEQETREIVKESDEVDVFSVKSTQKISEIEEKSSESSPRQEIPGESGNDLVHFETREESFSEILTKDKSLREKRVISHENVAEDIRKSAEIDDEEQESIAEELSVSQQDDYLYNENSVMSRKSSEASQEIEHDRTNDSSLENCENEDNDESKEIEGISVGKASINADWTISDSFKVPEKSPEVTENRWEASENETEMTIEPSNFSPTNLSEESHHDDRRETQNFTCDMDDVSMFIPKGESTTIGYKFDESAINVTKNDSMHTDELDDILDIIARESKQTAGNNRENEAEVANNEEVDLQIDLEKLSDIPTVIPDRIIPRPSDLNLTAEVEPVLQKLTEILQGVERNIARRRRSGNEVDSNRENVETKESTISAISTSESVQVSKVLSVASEKSEEKTAEIEKYVSEDVLVADERILDDFATATSPERISLPEEIQPSENASQDNLESLRLDPIEDLESVRISQVENEQQIAVAPQLNERTFEVLKGPEYEDISEESLEVSEILDRSESQRSAGGSKSGKIPEKYEITQKSEDVLRILDAISQQSYADSANKLQQQRHLDDVKISVQVFGSISPGFSNKKDSSMTENGEAVGAPNEDVKSVDIDHLENNERLNDEERFPEGVEAIGKYSRAKNDENVCRKEQDGSSESSEGADTPRGVSEIEMDSPRDPNESRLDIDALDDDLLSGNEGTKEDEAKVDFHGAPVIATSEKDIEMMIDKLKASLEQPGLEVAELEAKLLRIEQLQVELAIKKLEAEEVSIYFREIPNKPPPPYTPPGVVGRLSTPQVSPTLPPAVVPSNVEELTAFTEKATVLIFNAKNAGEDIMSLQPPAEICELSKDNNETAKQDRRIYNTFLFDLCKETIAEVYRSEYEKPGPSWTKPNVKTKPAMKIPKTVEELNEYVSKEVATLFGFKTKLQRENMVMRWSRKRRDRVDELLAREAQAEEDEWTKFHHDELAVKNELTVAILDTLILETANVVKAVYAKKRRVMV